MKTIDCNERVERENPRRRNSRIHIYQQPAQDIDRLSARFEKTPPSSAQTDLAGEDIICVRPNIRLNIHHLANSMEKW